jgi:hypothetical protein
MIDRKQLAETVYTLLLQKPERYRNFAEYWYMVKDLLKEFYDPDRLYLLGEYVDPSVSRRVPEFETQDEAFVAAMETYNTNLAVGLGGNQFEDSDGDVFVLFDPDVGK